MSANEKQVGGSHYKRADGGEEHWDRAWRLKYDPFQYIITKWIERWRDKGGVEDLKKAQHAIEKYIELNSPPEATLNVVINVDTSEIVAGLSEMKLSLERPWRCAKCGSVRTGNAVQWVCTKGDYCYSEKLPDWDEGIKRTGFIGFTYEGGTSTTDMYRCSSCREFITIQIHEDPRSHHTSCPGSSYVRQEPPGVASSEPKA